MLHEPASQTGPDPTADYKARLGIWMFLIYCAVYAGFVVINITSPVLMERTILWGMNLAVVYGMGLIIFAVVLAVVYDLACRRRESAFPDKSAKGGKS